MEDSQLKHIKEGDVVDLAYKLEWLNLGRNAGLGTEPIKGNKKEKISRQLVNRRRFYVQRVLRQTLNQFERFKMLVIEEKKVKPESEKFVLNPTQTSKLVYMLGMYSRKSIEYPVNTGRLLQHTYWSDYAWEANLWPQLDVLL